MFIDFTNYAVTAVSEGIKCRGDYYNPAGRTLYHVTISGPEVVNDQGQEAPVSHGVSYFLAGVDAQCPLQVGDHVTLKVLLEGHWDSYGKQMRNDMSVVSCTKV